MTSQPANGVATARATNARQAEKKAGHTAQVSPVYKSDSMAAIKNDRVTTFALYALFGGIVVGVVYFLALLLMA